MSMNLNSCIFAGNLGKDPEISTANGKNGPMKVARFSLAVRRSQEITDWVPLVAFGGKADFVEKYFHKGSGIIVECEYQQDTYTDKDGNKKSFTNFIVKEVKFPPAGGSKAADSNGVAEGFTPIPDGDGELPWG